MKKIILSSLLFILVLLIPYFPYKKAFCSEVYNPSKINIQVRYHEVDGELLVVYGKKYLKNYIVKNKLKGVNINKIYLIGKEPYCEIADFKIGKPLFYDFIVIGEFIDWKNGGEILTFDVDEWYPVYKNVKLKDTEIWHKYNYSLWRIVILVINIGMIYLSVLSILK